MPEEKLYEWTVLMRDDRMGFGRVYNVQAMNVEAACLKADEQAWAGNYKIGQLVVVSATRGREVGT